MQASDAYRASEGKLSAAHQALLKTRGIQFDFARAPPQPPAPKWLVDFFKALGEFGPILKFLFWGGLILAAALILWFIVREVLASRRQAKAKSGPSAADWRPEAGAARELLEAADRLAVEGRYDEALHLLLFRSIEEITGRRPGAVRPALTSRDIARLDAMPERPRSAFARIAERVETSFFGGRPVAAADFAAARGDYQAFAFAEDWA